MVSDIDFLESICERMQQVGLVESKTAFSTRMLGKGPSYLTSMKARDRHVPDEVAVQRASRLAVLSQKATRPRLSLSIVPPRRTCAQRGLSSVAKRLRSAQSRNVIKCAECEVGRSCRDLRGRAPKLAARASGKVCGTNFSNRTESPSAAPSRSHEANTLEGECCRWVRKLSGSFRARVGIDTAVGRRNQFARDWLRKHSTAASSNFSSGMSEPHSVQKSRVALSGFTWG